MCDVHFETLDVVEVGPLTAGDDITTFSIDGIKCGVAVCYDATFDEFIKIYAKVGKSLALFVSINCSSSMALAAYIIMWTDIVFFLEMMEHLNAACRVFIGCDLLFVPAAYEYMNCGEVWELVYRSRAADNQMFVAAISGARDTKVNYVLNGHSMFVDPSGAVLARAGFNEEILFHEIGTCVV